MNRKPKREYYKHKDMIDYALLKLEKDIQRDYDYLNSLITISAEPDNLTVTLGKYSISMTYQEWTHLNDAYFQQECGHIFDPYLSKIKNLAHTILDTITKIDDSIQETEMFFDTNGKLVVRPLDRVKKMTETKKKLKESMDKSVVLDIQNVDGETKIVKVPNEKDNYEDLHAAAVDYEKHHTEAVEKIYSYKIVDEVGQEKIDKSKEWNLFTKEKEISEKLGEIQK